MTNKVISPKYLPPFPTFTFPSGRMFFKVKDELFGKISGSKKLVPLYSWELYGRYLDDSKFKPDVN